VRASQAGDRAALEELLRRYLPGVRAFVRLRMGQRLRERESGSDLVQSVCTDLLTAHGLVLENEHGFRNWLYVAAMNKLRNHDRWFNAQKRDVARETRHQRRAWRRRARCSSTVAARRTTRASPEPKGRQRQRRPEGRVRVVSPGRIFAPREDPGAS
jgi:DNA-directed RNA polymerase specialized sigma24 family protein